MSSSAFLFDTLKAVRSSSEQLGVKLLEVQTYSSGTTSFKQTLDPGLVHLGPRSAVLVLDAMPRAELLLRQLLRLRAPVAVRQGSADGALFMTTGEGTGPRTTGIGHEVLQGIRVAPVAHADADSQRFVDTYREQQGSAPGDQALLVWRAMSRAWRGDLRAPVATVVEVREGDLVPFPAR